jgi:hypothetical protein
MTNMNNELDQVVVALDRAKRSSGRAIPIIAFNEIKLGVKRRYLVAFLIPLVGLAVVWGPPKSGKSFSIF